MRLSLAVLALALPYVAEALLAPPLQHRPQRPPSIRSLRLQQRRRSTLRCSGGGLLNGETRFYEGSHAPERKAEKPDGSLLGYGNSDAKSPYELSLASVRSSLVRQEETIIFGLIERAQFRANTVIYTDKAFKMHRGGQRPLFDRDASFLEFMLCETEKLHARVRRYSSPEEHAFFPGFVPEPLLPPLDIPQILAPHDVNVNSVLLRRYIDEVVPAVCDPGDDEQHGSSVICDIHVLQALSRRVHLGKFVAESKFQEDEESYRKLCKAGDAKGVVSLLTNEAVEKQVLQRAFAKASTYGQDIGATSASSGGSSGSGEQKDRKVEPAAIAGIYRNIIIPLTKDVEIMYLFQRTGYPCPPLKGINDPADDGGISALFAAGSADS